MDMMRWIYRIVGRSGWRIVLLSMIYGVLALSGVGLALIMRSVVDAAASGERILFFQMLTVMAALLLCQILLRALGRYEEALARVRVENLMRQAVFNSAMTSDFRKIDGYHTAEIMNRMTTDASTVTDGVVTMVPNFISMLLRILGVLVVLWGMEPKLCLLFCAGGALMMSLSMVPRRWLKQLSLKAQQADDKVRCFLQECLESQLIIRTFDCSAKMARTGAAWMQFHLKARMKRSNAANICSTGLNLIVQTGYVVGFLWGGVGILNGTVTYGMLTAVIQLIGQIQTPFVSLGSMFPKLSAVSASVERMMSLTGTIIKTSTVNQISHSDMLYRDLIEICFDDVSFSYENALPVLAHETFFVKKGEFVAITGESGVGKSTLLKLLMSVYDTFDGRIFFRTIHGDIQVGMQYITLFAYVPQGNFLMSGSIREIVGFAEKGDIINEERLLEACQAACALEFINSLPERFDTLLGEKGAGLSEGQMQRIAVARAIYSGRPVLLLDEGTSALDSDTEARMMGNLRRLKNRTVFLVTHRREACAVCDREIRLKSTTGGE